MTSLFLAAALATLPTPHRVLFIGNSYTSQNDLPQIFRAIVASAGSTGTVEVAQSTPGGITLAQHLQRPDTLKLIDQGDWDVVVLQAQSQEAAMAEKFANMREAFLAGAAGLFARIKTKNPRARVVLYQTWARHADYWKNPQADKSVGVSPADMQARIRKWYRQAAAQKAGLEIAPVGDAWELHSQTPNAPRLHKPDNSHPNWNGSYLAALVIYATVYQPAKLEVSYHGSLDAAEARQLQNTARQVSQRR